MTTPRLAFCGCSAPTMARLAEAGVDDGPRRATRHPDDAHRRRSSPRPARTAPSRRSSCALERTDRRCSPSPDDQCPNALRAASSRGDSASVTCGVGFADLSGFTALTQLLTPAELSDLLVRVRRRRQRRGACRRWTGGEVHRRRGDVGELVARTAGESRRSTSSTTRERGRRACRSAPVWATARCWPSAAITSATRSTWPPAGRRGRARTDPGRRRCSQRGARLAGDPAEPVDTQGFQGSGDGL